MDRIHHLGMLLGRKPEVDERLAMLLVTEDDLEPFSEIFMFAVLTASEENIRQVELALEKARRFNFSWFRGKKDYKADGIGYRFLKLVFEDVLSMLPVEKRKEIVNEERLSVDPMSEWKIHQYLAQGVFNDLLVLIGKSRGRFVHDYWKYWNKAFAVTAPLARLALARIREGKYLVIEKIIEIIMENSAFARREYDDSDYEVGQIGQFSLWMEGADFIDEESRGKLAQLRMEMNNPKKYLLE